VEEKKAGDQISEPMALAIDKIVDGGESEEFEEVLQETIKTL
jgi:hypothetical protein